METIRPSATSRRKNETHTNHCKRLDGNRTIVTHILALQSTIYKYLIRSPEWYFHEH